MKSGGLCRGIRHDIAHHGRCKGLAHRAEQDRKDDYCEDKIDQGTRRNDPGPLRQGLVLKRNRLFSLAQFADLVAGHAGGIGIAEHLDVAAEGNQAEFPTSTVAVGVAEKLPPETDGEDIDPNPAAPRHPIVTQLVHEDQDGQDYEKGQAEAIKPGCEFHPLFTYLSFEHPFCSLHRDGTVLLSQVNPPKHAGPYSAQHKPRMPVS